MTDMGLYWLTGIHMMGIILVTLKAPFFLKCKNLRAQRDILRLLFQIIVVLRLAALFPLFYHSPEVLFLLSSALQHLIK